MDSVYTSAGLKSIEQIIGEVKKAQEHGMVPFFVLYPISPEALERSPFLEQHAGRAADSMMARAIQKYKEDHS